MTNGDQGKGNPADGIDAQDGDSGDLSNKTPLSLEARIEELTEQSQKILANWQRAQADLANYRKQVERERADLIKFANASLTREVLVIMDDIERAVANVPENLWSYTWIQGIWLVGKKLESTLVAGGLEEISAMDQVFDPKCHQSVSEGEGEPGKVIEVVQKGYLMNGLLLRPALVIVGKTSQSETVDEDETAENPVNPELTSS